MIGLGFSLIGSDDVRWEGKIASRAKRAFQGRLIGCVSLGKSDSGFLMQQHSDHGVSKEPTNPLLVKVRRFL